MGRVSPTYYDNLFLAKAKHIVCKLIDETNKNHAVSSAVQSYVRKRKRDDEYSWEQFVESFNEDNEVCSKILQVLVKVCDAKDENAGVEAESLPSVRISPKGRAAVQGGQSRSSSTESRGQHLPTANADTKMSSLKSLPSSTTRQKLQAGRQSQRLSSSLSPMAALAGWVGGTMARQTPTTLRPLSGSRALLPRSEKVHRLCPISRLALRLKKRWHVRSLEISPRLQCPEQRRVADLGTRFLPCRLRAMQVARQTG